MKNFRSYLLKSITKVIVHYQAVINLLVKRGLGDKGAHWMRTLHEYDLEVKLTHILKGQGIYKLVIEFVDSPD